MWADFAEIGSCRCGSQERTSAKSAHTVPTWECVLKPSIVLVGHGSRDPEATTEFCRVVAGLAALDPERVVECGYLEFSQPVIADAIARCVERGARDIIVLPAMLMAGGHVKNDIPSEIHDAEARFPDVTFRYGRHLHLHPNLLELMRRRIEEAEATSPNKIARADSLLLVVGRGSSDPDANGDVGKLARLLGEGMQFGWSMACYSGVTTPLVPEALERCGRMGYRRIVLAPFLLFTGVLEKRIRRQTAEFAAAHPETEFLVSSYLNADPLLVGAFADRAEEAVAGTADMNCQLCKYRVPLPGFEDAVDEPQVGHHHGVRGIGQVEHAHAGMKHRHG
jgi:sirohydrochlorin cobaltochelatase